MWNKQLRKRVKDEFIVGASSIVAGAGGAGTGAAVGFFVFGPPGALVGFAVGSITGGWVGRGVGKNITTNLSDNKNSNKEGGSDERPES